MGSSAWTPVDESASGWTPVDEPAKAAPSPAQTTISAGPKFGTVPWLKEAFYNAMDKMSQGLPAAGATAGGLIGGGAGTGVTPGPGTAAGAVGGAAIGGMAGEAARRLLRQSIGFDAPQAAIPQAQGIAKEGAIQGAVQAGSEGLSLFAPMLKNAALSQYTKALAPTTQIDKSITQKIAPEMLQRGLRGSPKSIEAIAAESADALGPRLDAAYSALPANATAGSGTTLVGDLEKLKGRYIVNGQIADPQAVSAIQGVQDVVKAQGADISPESLRQLKAIFDNPVAARGGYAGADLPTQYALQAKKAAANSIRNIVGQASPDVAALNKELSFWLNVQKVTSDTALRQTGQAGGLLKVLTPLGSAASGAIGLASGGAHAGAEAAGGAALMGIAAHIMRSPGWRTTSAVFKNQFADALARGSVGDTLALATRLGLASQSSPRSDQTQTPSPSQ